MSAVRGALKKLAARLPRWCRQTLRRTYYASQIRRGAFRTPEPEFDRLREWVAAGDWALDIGANVGHYTLRLSALVGPTGRVIAIEPVPEAFETLVANAALAPSRNVTLINAAASDRTTVAGMTVPKDTDSGLENLYLARLSSEPAALQVFCVPVDQLVLPHKVAIVKIDTEGHELAVLRGMVDLLRRDHPTLIIEDNDRAVPAYLTDLGYSSEVTPGSSNRVYRILPAALAH